ncbi:O-methyltransferase, family 3 [Niveomyces insectorum RCEF 264]|uniref:O-methyltransferase, family 3 n=1 Tax=Niveomyces insectorum RCEF 264 TaxID=1081102 RepID=A0A167QEW3_9HYPO|nr:O-methyltransferase, family 3 [Niveomyces insectorum RCEF 264]
MAASPSNLLQNVPDHVRALLDRLHAESTEQENALEGKTKDDFPGLTFDDVMRDKSIALERDKAEYVYQLCRATGATTIVEAGTSYGVSTIYLALAAAANAREGRGNASGGARRPRVIATEHEPAKAVQARANWQACGAGVADVIDLREGDLRETLKNDVADVDFLLLDIWTPMALPTLKLVQPNMRRGAVVITDNTEKAVKGYADLLSYLRGPESGFVSANVPFTGGLEMSVYLPQA